MTFTHLDELIFKLNIIIFVFLYSHDKFFYVCESFLILYKYPLQLIGDWLQKSLCNHSNIFAYTVFNTIKHKLLFDKQTSQ